MKRTAFVLGFLATLVVSFAQKSADPWSKVEELKGGTDLRIYKAGSSQPLAASFADLNDDNLIVVIRNTETAIPKSSIDRIEARAKGGGRMHSETRESETPPDQSASNPREQTGPGTSSSTNLSFGSKGDFQIVYRRTAAATAKAAETR